MFEGSQLDTFGSGKFRVESKYVDRELDFIDDTLSVRLFLTPKFEIFWSIISAISVFVVYGFSRLKLATQHLFHDNSVDQAFATTSKMQAHVSGRVDMSVWVDRAPSPALPTTLFAAKFLTHIPARVTTVLGLAQAALFRSATQLALESRYWLFVHEGRLAPAVSASKEIF